MRSSSECQTVSSLLSFLNWSGSLPEILSKVLTNFLIYLFPSILHTYSLYSFSPSLSALCPAFTRWPMSINLLYRDIQPNTDISRTAVWSLWSTLSRVRPGPTCNLREIWNWIIFSQKSSAVLRIFGHLSHLPLAVQLFQKREACYILSLI